MSYLTQFASFRSAAPSSSDEVTKEHIFELMYNSDHQQNHHCNEWALRLLQEVISPENDMRINTGRKRDKNQRESLKQIMVKTKHYF